MMLMGKRVQFSLELEVGVMTKIRPVMRIPKNQMDPLKKTTLKTRKQSTTIAADILHILFCFKTHSSLGLLCCKLDHKNAIGFF